MILNEIEYNLDYDDVRGDVLVKYVASLQFEEC